MQLTDQFLCLFSIVHILRSQQMSHLSMSRHVAMPSWFNIYFLIFCSQVFSSLSQIS